MKEALKYLQAGAIVPVDMETTVLLVNALKEALAQPAQRPWVYLTDEHIKEIVGPYALPIIGYTRKLFDQIEAKSKELNNG